MRRQLLIVLVAAMMLGPSASVLAHHKQGHSGGNGKACPEQSQNPNGKPPSCGKQDARSKGQNQSPKGPNQAASGAGQKPEAEQQPPARTQCNDGFDNDGDGRADSSDPNDCRGDDDTEATTQCNDGLDNDRDGFVDTRDENDCRSGDVTESTTQCNDGFDNDADGRVDGSDANDCRAGDITENTGTCESDGFGGGETIASQAFGTENENGPISSELHANEESFGPAARTVHEASCVVASVDNDL